MLSRRVVTASTNVSGGERYKVAAWATRIGTVSAFHPSVVQAHLVLWRRESPNNPPYRDVIAIPRTESFALDAAKNS